MTKNTNALILYEDEQIIVCHKPAKTPTQSARVGTADMESILKNHLFKSGRFHAAKSGEPYLAVIHRLDQPVEGLLVFAKTPAAAKELNRQLTTSGFGKYYLATVRGIPVPEEGTLEDYLVKDARANSSRVCTQSTPGAKLARLHYKTIEIYGLSDLEKADSESETQNYDSPSALVEIHLDTGRHHQIRVQMAHFGHPLIGDRKYGFSDNSQKRDSSDSDQKCECSDSKRKYTFSDPDQKNASSPLDSERHHFQEGQLHLCAYKLTFRHPKTGKKMEFQI